MGPRPRAILALAVAAAVVVGAAGAAMLAKSGPTDDPGHSPSQVETTGTPDSNSPTPDLAPSPTPTGTPDGTRSAPPPPIPTPSRTPSPSPTPSRTPTPLVPGFVQAGGAFSYVTNDGTVVPVEAVAGLRAMLQGGRAIYVATASNRYGLAVGAYAGEFKPNVVMEQAEGSSAQTGGAVLVGPVVNRLIADRLAAVKNPADRWVIALPVDVRGEPLTSTVDVSFDDLGLHGWLDVPRVVVAFAGELPVVNAIPANGGVHVLVEQQGVTAWQCIDPTRLSLPPDRIDTTHPMNELLVYGTGQVGLRRDLHVDRRVALGYRSVTATGEVSVSLVVGTATYDVTPAQILTIADVPVFVAGA